MKSRSSVRQHGVVTAPESAKPVPVTLSSGVGGPLAANDEHASAHRERRVDPLWMIVAAMAFAFALLALLATFD